MPKIQSNYIKNIRLGTASIQQIINKVGLFLEKKSNKNFHIVNMNPETFMIAYHQKSFKRIVNRSDIILTDGIGIKLLAFLTHKEIGEKLAGTDLMVLLIKYASDHKKKVFFLGGNSNSAKLTCLYFKKVFPKLRATSSSGIKNKYKYTSKEDNKILRLIKNFKPNFLFVAYGPPFQENWINKHKNKLKGMVCMGVGGSFNFFSNKVPRAPKIFITIKLEWLWRFIVEPERTMRKIKVYVRYCFFSVHYILWTFLFKKNEFNKKL